MGPTWVPPSCGSASGEDLPPTGVRSKGFAGLARGGDHADVGGDRASIAGLGGIVQFSDDAGGGPGADPVDGGQPGADLVVAQQALDVAPKGAQAAVRLPPSIPRVLDE